jgi:outer membrane protein, heavy metal efflux system
MSERRKMKRNVVVPSYTERSLITHYALRITIFLLVATLSLTSWANADDLNLQELIDDALNINPEIKAAEAEYSASKYRIPQAGSLPDPMVMLGYQNEGTDSFTYGDMPDSQFMYSASQMFPFPGKRGLKGEMSQKESESMLSSLQNRKLRTIARVKELYYDLLFTYKSLELVDDRKVLFTRIEDTALARYSAGRGMQQEVIMAQTEKYMLLEREEMLRQRIDSIEAMLNRETGRPVDSPLGRPLAVASPAVTRPLKELIAIGTTASPDVAGRGKMIEAADARLKMARKEYYPDFTFTGNYMRRGSDFMDMWSVTAAMNIPLYYKTKQRQAVNEANALLEASRRELESSRLMLASEIRDNYSMMQTAERLMELYRDGLIPKAYQDLDASISGYTTGQIEAITTITRLKALIEFEALYWEQFALREKAIARIEALTGGLLSGPDSRITEEMK